MASGGGRRRWRRAPRARERPARRGRTLRGEALRATDVEAGVEVDFHVADVLTASIPGAPFDLVFDRGCLHCFFTAEERATFARQVAAHIAPAGLWLSLIGSTDGPARDHGPPRASARDVVTAVEPDFEVLSLISTHFVANTPTVPRAWKGLFRRRTEPAQQSTTSM